MIIDLQSKIRNSIILKKLPHDYFISSCFNFRFSNPKLNIQKEKKINETIVNSINIIFKKNCRLIDYDINKIDKKFVIESERLLPKKGYIGMSITQGNIYRKKEWPIEKIIHLSQEIVKKNKTPVFLIEKKYQELKDQIKNFIPSALFPEHDSNLSSPALVTCIGKRLDFAITIDNGIMHMLSLSKVPIVSLFGPTDSEKFAPQYKNSKILDTGGGVLNAIHHFSNEPFLIINPDTVWNILYSNEIKLMQDKFFENKKNKCSLLVANKKKSFDKSLKGDFNLENNLITRTDKEKLDYIYTGAQIIHPIVFSDLKEEVFSINKIWNQLIERKELFGIQSNVDFMHVTSLQIYKKIIEKV